MKRQIIAIVMLALMAFAGNAFGYGDVTPSQAADMVENEGAFILDVRTPEEWNWVGHPGQNNCGDGGYLEGHVLNVAYKIYHEGYSTGDVLIVNTQFVKDVERLLINKDAVIIITMCRSGKRSVSAAEALEDAGFTDVYNMLEGFEGEKDSCGYRTVNGWKNDGKKKGGLPYNYSGVGNYQD